MSQNPRVLVIDDDPLFRSLMMTHLRKMYLVSVASEGSEGYHKALQTKPDIAIIDIQMPGWDGLKTLAAFRDHPDLNKTKIVMLTSDSSKQTVMKAIQGGADSYLLKSDFSAKQLIRKIVSLTENGVAAVRGINNSQYQQASTPVAVATSASGSGVETDNTEMQAMLDGWE